ncbi:glycoside hydrolase family 35 protein [Cohnella herbarum]|uniref:Beta-galactosidase n=1 Tax=Cohnella herbarum TaxID=2728023 RepID=A0A7Z2VRV9_9BACL|nr:beta-galactosidase [Cohnella herbarum]QJD88406.1 beta-galactosidase [Cohnella herbarum]
MGKFELQGNRFIWNGQPIRILAGAIHYFRIVPEYWQDRLLKLKACGFNTVETYVPWNMHEPTEGRFEFGGMADLVRFVETAGELGLHVIVRPSPYICAEWEFGGLPAWLLNYPDIRLRCNDSVYLEKVDAYYDVLLPKLVPLLCTNGGPIIAMQIENEYGSYGNDKAYLTHLKEGMIRRGIDVLLFTSDGPEDDMLQGGTLPDVLATVNFGSRANEAFAKLQEYQPDGPLMCMEFWNGWFDHWMKPHHTRDAESVAETLREMMDAGASLNFYMFHGGTNFGFWNGANYGDRYEPTITSYDYDSPLSECGDTNEKYDKVRAILSEYSNEPPIPVPPSLPKRAYGTVELTEQAPLFGNLERLSRPVQRVTPEPMERLGQYEGFIVYRTRISGPRTQGKLTIQDVRDRAIVYVDGSFVGVSERWDPQTFMLDIPEEGAVLEILVENMGRINYGPQLKDHKGITEGVRMNNQFQYDWTIHTLPLNDLSGLTFADANQQPLAMPTFYRGTLEITGECADTFLKTEGWTKGNVWINGFHLGRYWERGPQQTLYVPAPLLKQGDNEVVLFELHGAKRPIIEFLDRPILGD